MTQFLEMKSYEITGSPELAGLLGGLRWLGAPEGERTSAPTSGWRGWPSGRRALAEAAMAGELADAASYPATAWWEDAVGAGSAPLSEPWWAAQAATPRRRSFFHGVSVALFWAAGATFEPIAFAPILDADLVPVPWDYRVRHAELLADLWVKYR